MKKVLFAISTMAAMLAVSCNKEEVSQPAADEPEVYEVKIGMSGAITSEVVPMTKTLEEGHIIGIDVWSCPNDGTTTTYSPYAWGIFDDDNISVSLLNGYKYKFTARTSDYHDNGATFNDCVYYKQIGNTLYPESLENVNKFFYNEEAFFPTSSNHDNLDMYYGEVTDYVPTKNGSVSITMERVSFGLEFTVTNFTSGSVEVNALGQKITITYPTTSFSSKYVLNYFASGQSEDISVSAQLIKSDNATIPLGSATVKVYKNKLTKVTIDATAPTTNNSFSLTYSTDEMTDSSESYEIGGGDSIDTDIDS